MNGCTPGPWEVVDQRPEGITRVVILGPKDERSTHKHGRAHIVEMRGWLDKDGDDEMTMLADAHLMAAAPDLLKACEHMHSLCAQKIAGPHNTGSRPDICFICATIAKARGKE